MNFEGWVPNATGNLSFGGIGSSLKRRVHARQHLRIADKRWLVVAQTRINGDRLLPRWAWPTLGLNLPAGSKRRAATYILTGTSVALGKDKEGALKGTVSCILRPGQKHFLFGPRDDTKAERAFREVVKTAQNFLLASEAERKGLYFSTPRESDWNNFEIFTEAASEISCSFILHRTGKIFLDVVKIPEKIDAKTLISLINQLYYFIKDSVHTHYHHDPSSDGITEISKVNSTPDWRQKTVRNLYREVMDLRRSGEDDQLSNALGLIAYAKTFSGIFGSRDYHKNGAELTNVLPLPVYQDGIITSIQLRRENRERSNDRRHLDLQFVIGAIIATCAALIGLYDFMPSDSFTKIFAERAVDILSYSPLYYIAVLINLAVVYFANNRHGAGRFRRWLYGPIYRMFAWLPQSVLVLVPLIVTFISVVGIIVVLCMANLNTPDDKEQPRTKTENGACKYYAAGVEKLKLDNKNFNLDLKCKIYSTSRK